MEHYKNPSTGRVYDYDRETQLCQIVPGYGRNWVASNYRVPRMLDRNVLDSWVRQSLWVVEFDERLRVPEGL
jgi:hypothetical protein